MPSMPPRPCTTPNCKEYATKRGKCDAHQPESGWGDWAKNQGTTHTRGYGRSWVKLRKLVFKRDSHLCQDCLKAGIYRNGNQCDHIIPKSQGGLDSLDNLQCLCENCHKMKTNRERKNGND